MDKISELYEMINSIYYQMFLLELNDEFDDEQYGVLMDFLKEKISEEDELVKEYIGDDKELYMSIMNSGNDFTKWNLVRLSAYVKLNEMFDEDFNEKEKLERRIFDSCRDSVLMVYLSLLQEYIDSGEDYSENLLNCKYLGAFANHSIEKILIENNFYVGREVDIYLDCVLDVLPSAKISKKEISEVVQASYVSMLFKDIEKLLKLSDIDYNDVDGVAISISSQCMIRACLSLMSECDYESLSALLNMHFHRLINDDNGKSLEILDRLLQGREENKKRVRRISFKLRG